ncbi:hypothetical protein [Bacillus massilinigeriensis]|uniref:hypothetical protein n=1 Tax=Bacillus mediterraneensis TaxID=1805474 RepID=UPI0008F94CA4|nr:hypothetical protein [Bacillus mediterraneensis]
MNKGRVDIVEVMSELEALNGLLNEMEEVLISAAEKERQCMMNKHKQSIEDFGRRMSKLEKMIASDGEAHFMIGNKSASLCMESLLP